MRPLIGLTTYACDEKGHYTLPTEYPEAVRRGGGIPLLLTPGESEIEPLLSSLDGVIICGGGDINPKHYAGDQHDHLYMVDDARDETELAICQKILHYGIPTLGICRGLQIINIALGGTLHAHLEDTYGDTLAHRAPPRETVMHDVTLEPTSTLYAITRQATLSVVSWHHQAVDNLGTGLRVSAVAEDGVIEAVELIASDHWLIAVQWHPELSAATDKYQQSLFNSLIHISKETRHALKA